MDAHLIGVFEKICRSAGLDFDPVEFQRELERLDRARQATGEPESLSVQSLALAHGFAVEAGRSSLANAFEQWSTGSKVLIGVPQQQGPLNQWLTIVRKSGREFLVNDGAKDHWVTMRSLAGSLGVDTETIEVDRLILQPIGFSEGNTDFSGGQSHGHGPHGSAHHGPPPLRRLLTMIRPERRDIQTVIIYAVGVGLLSLAAPLAIEALVSTVARTQLRQQLLVIALVLFACLALSAAFRSLQTYVVEIIQRRLFMRLASDLAYRLPRAKVESFDTQNGPELVNRFFDILTIQKVASLLLLDGVSIVLQSFFGLLILASYSPYLLGFDIIIVFALTFLLLVLGHGGVRSSIEESRSKYAVAAFLEEIVRSPLAFRTAEGQETARIRTNELCRQYLGNRRSHFLILMRQILFSLGFQALATAILLGLGGWLVLESQLTLGQLVAAELIVATVLGSFSKLGKHLEAWYDLMAAMDKIGHLLDLPIERRDGETLSALSGPAKLEVRGLSYHYQGRRPCIENLDLCVEPGARIAILGPPGSGKSTLLDLIYGLRAPDAGLVLLDDLNLRDLGLNAVRSRIALVRGPDLLADSILANLRALHPGVALCDVQNVLQALQINESLAELKDGLSTTLTASGAPLSSKQALFVTLACAILGSPRLLLLDETLDSLDPTAVAGILDRDFAYTQNCTIVVVTHSRTIADLCDRVIFLPPGRPGQSLLGTKDGEGFSKLQSSGAVQ